MALTDTKKAKEFMAGAPDIKLKGDLRLKASVDEPFYRDNEGDRDEHSFRMFNKPYKELNEFELEEFQEEMMRLMNKFSSAPDPMDERNNALENLADQYYGKPLRDLTPREIELLEEALDEMTKKDAPSMMMAADGGRAQYGLGSLVKSVKKAVKGVVGGVKDVVKSPLGLAAIGLGINQFGLPFGGAGKGFLGNIFGKGGTLSSLLNLSG